MKTGNTRNSLRRIVITALPFVVVSVAMAALAYFRPRLTLLAVSVMWASYMLPVGYALARRERRGSDIYAVPMMLVLLVLVILYGLYTVLIRHDTTPAFFVLVAASTLIGFITGVLTRRCRAN